MTAHTDPLLAPLLAGDDDDSAADTGGGSDRDAADEEPAPRPPRISRWDRPPPPKDWRWWVGSLGRLLIVTGLLMLGFVAYQLWGTGIETARAQRALENDFEELLAEVDTEVDTDVAADTDLDAAPAESVVEIEEPPEQPESADDSAGAGDDTADATDDGHDATSADAAEEPDGDSTEQVVPVPVADQSIPDIENGDALARLEIPSIGVDDIVVAGVTTSDLKKGPGHFPETPMPGQLGNSAIAGHRTTYGQPFYDVDKLEPGDDIILTTLDGQYVYTVTGQQIVSPSDYHVVTTTDPDTASLTLTSCHPRWSASQRIVISSELDENRSSPVGEAVLNYGRDDPADPEPLAEAAAETLPAGAEDTVEDTVADAETDEPADTAGEDAAVETTPIPDEDETASETGSDAAADPSSSGSAPVADDDEIADAFAEGWFTDTAAIPDLAMWALVLIGLWIVGYLLARRFRNLAVGVAVAAVPFVIALYFFYQNVNRLLPPNL